MEVDLQTARPRIKLGEIRSGQTFLYPNNAGRYEVYIRFDAIPMIHGIFAVACRLTDGAVIGADGCKLEEEFEIINTKVI